MPRMKKVKAGPDGWSDWESPKLKGYRMGCCDCGLVHDMEFKVFEVDRHLGNGYWRGKPAKGMKIMFRARRNERSTAQIRRKARESGI